jgi:hypothetical protein
MKNGGARIRRKTCDFSVVADISELLKNEQIVMSVFVFSPVLVLTVAGRDRL